MGIDERKCYPGTSPMAITECCDLEADVPLASMNEVLIGFYYYPEKNRILQKINFPGLKQCIISPVYEVLPRDQPYGHY
jgi:hypothetical protein